MKVQHDNYRFIATTLKAEPPLAIIGRAMRILIVDDSQVAVNQVRRCLEGFDLKDLQFMVADNGILALGCLGAGGIDLLITDDNMPQMTGRELVFAIHDAGALLSLPTIFMAPAVSPGLVAVMRSLGVAVVAKPVTPDALARAMAQVLAGRPLVTAEVVQPVQPGSA